MCQCAEPGQVGEFKVATIFGVVAALDGRELENVRMKANPRVNTSGTRLTELCNCFAEVKAHSHRIGFDQ